MEDWLLKAFSEHVFNTGKYPLPVMSGKPQHIHLKDNAIPYAIHSPIPVPCHWRGEVEKLLQMDVDLGILEKYYVGWCTRIVLDVGEPVEWCTRWSMTLPESLPTTKQKLSM